MQVRLCWPGLQAKASQEAVDFVMHLTDNVCCDFALEARMKRKLLTDYCLRACTSLVLLYVPRCPQLHLFLGQEPDGCRLK